MFGPPDFIVGVDLGQAHDPTAIAVAELIEPEIHFRHLERLPLRTPCSTRPAPPAPQETS